MSESAELAELKAELAAVRAQVAKQQERLDDLKPFLHVQQQKDGTRYLHITCWGIELVHPDVPDKSQMLLYANKDGPGLSLWGSDSKARMILKVNNDVAEFSLFTKDLKHAVWATVKEPGGLGQVGVFANGSPRAVMKAANNDTGVVSVVHDDGQMRATMASSAHDGGEFVAVTPDMKMGVKVSSNGPHGGMVVVHHANGKAGVILACTAEIGGVLVNNSAGKLQATLPAS